MRELPKVRWLALLLAIAFGVVFVGVNFDLAAAIGHLGSKAAGIGALLLGIAKIIEEAMRSIDGTDPAIRIEDGHIHTMGRGVEQPSFWRRVL